MNRKPWEQYKIITSFNSDMELLSNIYPTFMELQKNYPSIKTKQNKETQTANQYTDQWTEETTHT